MTGHWRRERALLCRNWVQRQAQTASVRVTSAKRGIPVHDGIQGGWRKSNRLQQKPITSAPFLSSFKAQNNFQIAWDESRSASLWRNLTWRLRALCWIQNILALNAPPECRKIQKLGAWQFHVLILTIWGCGFFFLQNSFKYSYLATTGNLLVN